MYVCIYATVPINSKGSILHVPVPYIEEARTWLYLHLQLLACRKHSAEYKDKDVFLLSVTDCHESNCLSITKSCHSIWPTRSREKYVCVKCDYTRANWPVQIILRMTTIASRTLNHHVFACITFHPPFYCHIIELYSPIHLPNYSNSGILA